MKYELKPATAEEGPPEELEAAASSSFRLSARPIIDSRGDGNGHADLPDLPRSYGTQTLCLMARDPHTLFAYWDIDWNTAFREEVPPGRKVHLRLLDSDGAELSLVEVEPMAGNCYVTVPAADAAYSGEIGYFRPAGIWNRLAGSEVVATPPDSLVESEEADFGTVPFHLSFQHMIDRLRISKQENESLMSMLAELRERAASAEQRAQLTAQERDLANLLRETQSNATEPRARGSADAWTQQKLERILGFGATSPVGGFGGSSRAL